jgi:hypothetical protein
MATSNSSKRYLRDANKRTFIKSYKMKHSDINEGDKVVYIPHHLLVGDKNKMVEEKNLGVVTSKNDSYIFVRFKGNTGSQACKAEDLYTLKNRQI